MDMKNEGKDEHKLRLYVFFRLSAQSGDALALGHRTLTNQTLEVLCSLRPSGNTSKVERRIGLTLSFFPPRVFSLGFAAFERLTPR